MKTAHLDYETLADLAEGLLDDEQAASANDHLASCTECLDRSADLADVSQLLADAPVPPLPIELAERIDAAIAAEASSSPIAVGAPSRRRRHLRVLSAAAAAVVAVGGGALVGKELLHSSTSPEYTKSQAAQDPDGPSTDRSLAGAPPSPEMKANGRAAPASGGYRLSASGTDYKTATLSGQVSAVLKATGNDDTAVSAIGVDECVAQIAKSAKPLLVDIARYNDQQATVIVLRGTGSQGLDIWVVGPKCSATTPDVLTHTSAAGG